MSRSKSRNPERDIPVVDPEAPLLSVRDLQVWYELRKWGFAHVGDVRAVDGVSFDLKQGDSLAVVGESGCGKSSLMKAILGLNRPTSGQILFEGRSVGDLSGEDLKWYRSQVGYVQQDPFGALPTFMNIKTILEEPLIINGVKSAAERKERIERALDEVKLTPVEDFLDAYPHMISGGQQQRVVIARSMILEPKLLVADEPVSMLDASVRVEILQLLEGLQESHDLAVIYITHDLSTVRYFSEHIFVMYAGRIAEFAEVNEILDNPAHPYTHALMMASSDPDARNAAVMREVPPGEPPSLVTPPRGCRFHPRCAYAIEGTCDKEVPKAFAPGPDHRVYCWLYDESLRPEGPGLPDLFAELDEVALEPPVAASAADARGEGEGGEA